MANYRLSRRFRVMATAASRWQQAKSSSAIDSRLQIKNTGTVDLTKEQYLAWDRLMICQGTMIYTPDTSDVILGQHLRGFLFYMSTTYQIGYALHSGSCYGRG